MSYLLSIILINEFLSTHNVLNCLKLLLLLLFFVFCFLFLFSFFFYSAALRMVIIVVFSVQIRVAPDLIVTSTRSAGILPIVKVTNK